MRARPLDAVHFSLRPWEWRAKEWVRRAQADKQHKPFLEGNVALIREILSDPDIGIRMVVNIGPDALLSFLRSGSYRNIYERPAIGGEPRQPDPERITVDGLLGIDAPNTYFGALALEGAGVRYYGAYCMVIDRNAVDGETRLFDRDSYDLLVPPLAGRSPPRTRRIVESLKGRWATDAVDMLVMKMLPRLPASQHLITVGNVSRLVMNDQEFVEVHREAPIGIGQLEEIRHSSDDAAVEAWIRSRARQSQAPSLVEMLWVSSREAVSRELERVGVPERVVSGRHGGEPWA
jgi:hypothetical protein